MTCCISIYSATRNVMTDYWKEHSKEPTVKEMMLDSHAEDIGKLEQPEILSMLPDLEGKDVVELGAGIGYCACYSALVIIDKYYLSMNDKNFFCNK